MSACAAFRPEAVPGALLDAAHVGVLREDGGAEGERRHGVGRVAPDAGQLGQVVGPAAPGDVPRGAVEVHRTPVVPEPLPLANDVAGRRGRERLDRRPALEPGEVARDDALDLRLLEHDLQTRIAYGSRVLPPGEVAAMRLEPGQEQVVHAGEG